MQADYVPDRHLKSFEEVATAALEHWLGGAGALTRQYKTILKYLAATRVLKHLSAQFAFTNDGSTPRANGHCRLGTIITEAKLLTAEVLGKPLLNSDQEWIRAQSVIHGVMAEYQREIDWLRAVFPTSDSNLGD